MISAHFLTKQSVVALVIFCLLGQAPRAGARDQAAVAWVDHGDAKLSLKRQFDGDSFAMEFKSAKGRNTLRTFRLYGADCPETDARGELLASRIADQAKDFGCKPEEIPALGREPEAFTGKLLSEGKPLIKTLGITGEKAPHGPKDPPRYYALIEVTAPDGQRRMLHELLLEAGSARAHGQAAPWPPDSTKLFGGERARKKFTDHLESLEKEANHARRGAWKKGAP